MKAVSALPARAAMIAAFAIAAANSQTIDDLSKVENNPTTKPPADIIPGPSSTPAQSADSMMVRPGFKLDLFASEPMVVNPMAMAFDHLGRLWVAEALDYPTNLTNDPFAGNDRIKVLEDTDGDGKADKVTVFAEGLNLVSAIALVPEGVVVGMAPNIVLLTDTDGDGKADTKKILYSGFARGDTHGVLGNFQYGTDNWVYATCGLAGMTIDTTRYLNGMFRFKADGSKIEWVGNFPNNTFGLGFNEAGQVFGGTANGQHVVYESIPDRYYLAAGLPPKMASYQSNSTSRGVSWTLDHFIMEPITKSVLKVDFLTEFTASTTAEVYTSREFPKEYWNRASFACEPTGHLCHIDWQEPKGSEYVSKSGRNFMASKDPWTAPIGAKVGPKGELYVQDWYDAIVQHNCWAAGQNCGVGSAYPSARRDKQFGRIWRVSYASATPAPVPDLKEATLPKLVATLKHPNRLWRMQAQRLLIAKKDPAAVPLLAALLNDNTTDEVGINGGVAHALWTLGALGAIPSGSATAKAAYALAWHPSWAVRIALLDVMPRDAASRDLISSSGLLYDANPHVRLKAMMALTEMPRATTPIKVVTAHRDLDRLSKDAVEILDKAQPLTFVDQVPPLAVLPTAPKLEAFRTGLYARAGRLETRPLIGLPAGTFSLYDAAGHLARRIEWDGQSASVPFSSASSVYRFVYAGPDGIHARGTILAIAE